MLSDSAKAALKAGEARVRLKRIGMMQFVVFKIRRIKLGGGEFPVLHSEKVIELGELQRVADEIGLPISSQDRTAFPEGTGAKDFLGL